ncbi:MAG: class I SAM-dependent methyltransferase [Ardenticatenales bacterium]|nr:class I SAM-dependent methyltransferase [Ardenticatenales bacterium]
MKRATDDPNPWLATRTRTGAEYDAPYEKRAQSGIDIHGEANLVMALLAEYGRRDARKPHVLDAGCGTGRIAIELARRGCQTVGVDLDEVMLAQARQKAPELRWLNADLVTVTLNNRFDLILMAGNVMIYLTPNTEAAVLANMASHLKPGGLLLAAFELTPTDWTARAQSAYTELTAAAGLQPLASWSTWEQAPWQPGANYLVALHQRPH